MRSLFSLLFLCLFIKQRSLAQHLGRSKQHRGVEVPLQVIPPFQLTQSTLAPATSRDSEDSASSAKPDTEPTPLASVLDAGAILLLPHENVSASNTEETEVPPRQLFMGYYPDWAGPTFSPENVDWKRYDWVDFAFALPTPDFQLTWDDPEGAPDLLRRVVAAAHASDCKVKLSIGGWSGSKYFSAAVATPQSRQTFATNIVTAYTAFQLNGIDVDWEYPGHEGERGNLVDPQDTGNLLSFFKLLRTVLPPSARITAAAQTLPFVNAEGKPSKDMSKFADALDWILLMNYDTWGSSTTPGPNAPLHDGCGDSVQPEANAVAAYNAWTRSGFPPSKLSLGVPSYGYVSTSNAEKLRSRSSLKVVDENGGSDSQVQFRDLVEQGVLVLSTPAEKADGSPMFVGSGGFERRWDTCSETPFLRSSATGQIVTYDDPESLAMKAEFARQVGMLGVNMFDIHGDTDEYHLADSIRRAMDL